ncbi:uncharacterized protein MELLADRAFT_59274 [Melampsora larici-populina 98AG31]|uniref:F-box domain-containing protein n=1 Tax=Melampsora larici-populina (strain 98AG31 / pathotype 3-4-7) TaxID=747676 RepID=F4R5N8_MELLP|nr:uncharacterized protein MELLADRAFT_59274 [Melampsora larici-populina 98AG31]EGG12081.1 hypothetical protein MELLADRAFT_59274 [Melampsora larici-populina 98AG31]
MLTPSINSLPVEIVHMILEIFIGGGMGSSRYNITDPEYADLDVNEPSVDELNLRFNRHSNVVSYTLSESETSATLLKKLVNFDKFHKSHLPVQDLEPVFYRELAVEIRASLRFLDVIVGRYPFLSMDEAVNIIKLLGHNLNKLNLWFFSGLMCVTPALINAVKQLKNLEKLSVIDWNYLGHPRESDTTYIGFLLLATPNIKHLTISGNPQEVLDLTSPALSKLQTFYFSCNEEDFEAVAHICKLAKDTLRVIGYRFKHTPAEGRTLIFEQINNTLEGLFVNGEEGWLPEEIVNMEFPRLRVVKIVQLMWISYDDLLDKPYVRNIRTLVIDSSNNSGDWEEAIRYGDGIKSLRKLKYIIFITKSECSKPDAGLLHDLGLKGIKYYISPRLTPEKLMVSTYQVAIWINIESIKFDLRSSCFSGYSGIRLATQWSDRILNTLLQLFVGSLRFSQMSNSYVNLINL